MLIKQVPNYIFYSYSVRELKTKLFTDVVRRGEFADIHVQFKGKYKRRNIN